MITSSPFDNWYQKNKLITDPVTTDQKKKSKNYCYIYLYYLVIRGIIINSLLAFDNIITFQVESLIKTNGNEFMWNKDLGYISTCPTNVGTGVRCSVHVKLPRLSRDVHFESICKSLRLEIRGTCKYSKFFGQLKIPSVSKAHVRLAFAFCSQKGRLVE